MSSPKRASKVGGKSAVRPAVKPAAKPTAARSARPAVAVDNSASLAARQVAATMERSVVDGTLDLVSAEALQKLIAAACRLYGARRQAGEDFMPVPRNSITATDVMLTASGLLRAGDLAVFELGMWQNWTGR